MERGSARRGNAHAFIHLQQLGNCIPSNKQPPTVRDSIIPILTRIVSACFDREMELRGRPIPYQWTMLSTH